MLKNLTPLPLIATYRWDVRKKASVPCKQQVFYGYNEEGNILLSAEDGPAIADYWGECNNGIPYIAPELEAWAKENNGYWEWENAGSIVFKRN